MDPNPDMVREGFSVVPHRVLSTNQNGVEGPQPLDEIRPLR